MVLITPDDGPSGLTTSINALAGQLADMRDELEDKYQQVKAGDFTELKDAKRVISEIREWLKIALEAEVQLEQRRKAEKGIVLDFAVDFDDARAEIGCRLDRLRRARCPGRIYRKPE